MLDVILDTVFDGLKLLPFLFVAFLIIEFIEHRYENKTNELLKKTGKFGPFFGSLLGLVPQCGFSVLATNLYVTRLLTMGTLIAIYLSTSDEMLPVMLSGGLSYKVILTSLAIKFGVGLLMGFLIDLLYRPKVDPNYEICDHEHCSCHKSHSIIKASLIHTLKIFIFIFIINFLINTSFYYFGEDYLAKILLKDNIFGSFLTSLIGLIPNCGASVALTELYINHSISFGSMIAGLLTGSGVGLVVLIKNNQSLKNTLLIISLLYLIGSIVGLVINIIL